MRGVKLHVELNHSRNETGSRREVDIYKNHDQFAVKPTTQRVHAADSQRHPKQREKKEAIINPKRVGGKPFSFELSRFLEQS